MPGIALATCAKFPQLTESDAVFAAALEKRGAQVIAAPWNADFEPFANADVVIIRSTWDYFEDAPAFAKWIDRLEGVATVFNTPAILRWNMAKTYLLTLAQAGVPVPPIQPVKPEAAAIRDAIAAMGLNRAVVKPLIGATASGLTLLDQPTKADFDRAASMLRGVGLVQAFVPEVENAGEISCIFIDGAFTHAIRKTPKQGDIRVQEEHGGASMLFDAPGWMIDAAANVLRCCPGAPLYARIDGVPRNKEFLLMEAELVEPELFFTYCPEAAARLAEACLERMKR